jgi:hypothetical protein
MALAIREMDFMVSLLFTFADGHLTELPLRDIQAVTRQRVQRRSSISSLKAGTSNGGSTNDEKALYRRLEGLQNRRCCCIS